MSRKLCRATLSAFVLICALGVQRPLSAAPPQANAPAVTHIVGMGNFSHIVADLDRAIAFYREGLGLDLAAPVRPFEAIPDIQKAANVPGAETRYVVLKVPGSAMGVELIEYRGIDRKPVSPRFQDPGAANLIVSVCISR